MTSLGHPRYRQDRLIAVGGMGEVWAGTDTVLDREVAIKVLKKEYADDATFRARFEAEAKHAAALHHPHVAGVMDYGEVAADPAAGEPARPYLVMELVRGEPLSALLAERRPMNPQRAAEIIAQAAAGIHAAHLLGIVHRDVKPGNLIVTPEGNVKVTDFGIARAADAVPLTATGQVIGTPHYLSPEQAEGKEATPLSDVYSLGVVLYECVAGQRLFTADSPVGVALAHVRDPAPELPDSVPAGLREVTRRALAKDPAERPQSAAALAEALRGDLTATTAAPPVGVAAGAAAAGLAGAGLAGAATRSFTSTSHEPATATPPPERPRRRVPPALLAVAAVVLVVLGVVAALALSGDEDPAATDPGASATPTAEATPPTETEAPAPSEPEPEPEPETETVTVSEDDYVGQDEKDASDQLKDLGLKPKSEKVDNDGTQEEGTVASVSPTGEVEEGTEITLEVWDEPAPAEEDDDGGGPPAEVDTGGPNDEGQGGNQ